MPQFEWDRQTTCDRYHSTLNASICLIRYRSKKAAGCQKCQKGEEIELEFGSLLDNSLKDPYLMTRVIYNFKGRAFFQKKVSPNPEISNEV